MCLLDEMGTSKSPHGFMARVWLYLWARLWVASQSVFAALDQCDHVLAFSLSAEGVIERLVAGIGDPVDLGPGHLWRVLPVGTPHLLDDLGALRRQLTVKWGSFSRLPWKNSTGSGAPLGVT